MLLKTSLGLLLAVTLGLVSARPNQCGFKPILSGSCGAKYDQEFINSCHECGDNCNVDDFEGIEGQVHDISWDTKILKDGKNIHYVNGQCVFGISCDTEDHRDCDYFTKDEVIEAYDHIKNFSKENQYSLGPLNTFAYVSGWDDTGLATVAGSPDKLINEGGHLTPSGCKNQYSATDCFEDFEAAV